MKRAYAFMILSLTLGPLSAADPPRAEISNGVIRAKLYLPDAQNGYYRGTRFDWSGVISSLEYQGHNYFGEWFEKFDPTVHDVDLTNGVRAGTPSAITGPVEEFSTNGKTLGYDEAPAGGTFIKIGVGVLRKPEEANYDHYNRYAVVDPGKWTVRRESDSIEFIQEVSGPFGYAYRYSKTVRLSKGKPEMVLEHSLRNTGKRAIETAVYDHNFLVIDNQPTGPDFVVTLPFELRPAGAMKDLAEVSGKQLKYLRTLRDADVATTTLAGFGPSAQDYDITVENRKTGAGVRITGDQPLMRLAFWSIWTVVSPEPFIRMQIEPGAEAK